MKEKVLFFGTFSLIVLIIVFVDFRELNKFIYPIFNGFGLLDGGNMSSLQRLSYGFRLTAIVVATVIMFWQFTFCQNVMSPIQTKISFAKSRMLNFFLDVTLRVIISWVGIFMIWCVVYSFNALIEEVGELGMVFVSACTFGLLPLLWIYMLTIGLGIAIIPTPFGQLLCGKEASNLYKASTKK